MSVKANRCSLLFVILSAFWCACALAAPAVDLPLVARATDGFNVKDLEGKAGLDSTGTTFGMTIPFNSDSIVRADRIEATKNIKYGSAATSGTVVQAWGSDGETTYSTRTIAQFVADFVAGVFQPLDADLTALAALSGTGIAARTAADTWALRTMTAVPGSGIAIANADGAGGAPEFDTGDELTGLTGISGSGLVSRSSGSNYAGRTITGDTEIVVADGDGTLGNPTLSIGSAIARTADIAAGYQPLDADLTTISTVKGDGSFPGFLMWTTDWNLKQLAGGTGIDIANAGGVGGDPAVSLADTAVTPGSYGDATHSPAITIDQQGRITAASETAISGGGATFANPTATVNGTVVNGSATDAMRSDAAPALADPFTPADGTQNITGGMRASTAMAITGTYPANSWPGSSQIALGNSGSGGQAQGIVGHTGANGLSMLWNFARNLTTPSQYYSLGVSGTTTAYGILMDSGGIVARGTASMGTTLPPPLMTLTSSQAVFNIGIVGIGDATPDAPLEVVGDDGLMVSRTAAGDGDIFHVYYSGGGYYAQVGGGGASGQVVAGSIQDASANYSLSYDVNGALLYAPGSGDVTLQAGSGTVQTASSDLAVDGDVSADNLASGTYTPTLTIVSGCDSVTAHTCQYSRVGDTMIVSGEIEIDPSGTASPVSIGISLPIASDLVGTGQCVGSALGGGGTIDTAPLGITGDATNDRASLNGQVTSSSGSTAYYFLFQARIL